MPDSQAAANPIELFQQEWPLYRKIVDNNYMFHREIYRDIKNIVEKRWSRQAVSVLEMGCGDASQTVAALLDCPISLYQGYDLSETALALAARNLAALSCQSTLVCTDMLEGLASVQEPFDIVFSSFVLHHLDADDKRLFFKLCHKAMKPEGVLILVDVMRDEQQDLPSYLDGYIGHAARHWSALTPEELAEVVKHIRENDYPESHSRYHELAMAGGFSRTESPSQYTWHRTMVFSNH